MNTQITNPSFTETEQTIIRNAVHGGWTARTRIKIDGKNWELTTCKRNNKTISTHCHAVQDEGNGSISFVMFGFSKDESFHLNVLTGQNATEKTITEAHTEGLKQFHAKKEAGELPKQKPEEVITIGQVLFTDGLGNRNERAVYEINGNQYKTVYLDGSKAQVDDFVRPYSKKFGIGTYFKPEHKIELDEINRLLILAAKNMEIEAEQNAVKQKADSIEAAKKSEYLSQFQRADRRTTTNIIKRHIAATWPTVQTVTVKTDTFSGGDSMDVKYHAAESIPELEQFIKSFQYGQFNGMNDMYEHHHNREAIVLERHILEEYKYVSTRFVKCDPLPVNPVTAGVNVTDNGNITIKHNKEKNGVEIRFKAKPTPEVLADLKSNYPKFRWSKFSKCWYAIISTQTINKAAGYGSLPESLKPDANVLPVSEVN